MAQEKKHNVNDIEKLRKILDNPLDPTTKKLISPDDKTLDSVRRRLTNETVLPSTRPSITTSRMSFSLEPTITIRPRIKPISISRPATPLPEFEPVLTPSVATEPFTPEEPLVEMDDLIEIEKIDMTLPEFSEVSMPSRIPSTIEQALPEWQPVDESRPNEPPVAPKEASMPHETPSAEKIPEFEPLDSKMIPEEAEKSTAWEPVTESEPAIPLLQEPPEFQREEPQGQSQIESRQQIRAQKKAEKQQQKEAKRLKKIERKKLKMETQQKEKEAKRLVQEQPTVEPPPETPPEIKVDMSAFTGIKSIDEHIGELLYRNGYFSLDNLRDATIDDLVQIRGIKRKLAKKIKKEIEQKTAPQPKDEFVPIKKRANSKKPRAEPEDVSEWESFSVNNSEELTVTLVTHAGYTLYKKEQGKGAKKTTIHFFSKGKPATGTPASVPKGYQIAVNKKTKVPYLKKKK